MKLMFGGPVRRARTSRVRQRTGAEVDTCRDVLWLLARTGFSILLLCGISDAQTVTLTLQQDLSSKLPSGTAFTANDPAGKIYRGKVITHPARRVLRRGSMILIFDDPVVPVTKTPEGVFQPGTGYVCSRWAAHSPRQSGQMTQ